MLQAVPMRSGATASAGGVSPCGYRGHPDQAQGHSVKRPEVGLRQGSLLCCRAPALFAALLRRAGVAPALLPLLAEPARAAIQGLGILARRRHPEQTAAFLASLKENCAGARTDAQLVRRCLPAPQPTSLLSELQRKLQAAEHYWPCSCVGIMLRWHDIVSNDQQLAAFVKISLKI